MPAESQAQTYRYDVITLFATAKVNPDARPGLAAALRESRTQLTSQTGYLMRFGDSTHRELTVFDVTSLPIQSYPVSESAFESLPERVRERLGEVGGVQIVAKYDSDEGAFRDVMWPGDHPGNTVAVDEEAGSEETAMEATRLDQENTHREETSAQTYRPITRSEFEVFLDKLDIEFTREAYRWTDEWVYEAVLDDGEKCLRVFSSIDREDNASRGAGSDAIKSVLLLNVADEDEEPEWRPLRKPKRTYRIQTWPQNLREKLENAVATKDEMKACLECGRPMVLQSPKGKKRQFWGCSGYYERTPSGERECENTAPVQ